MKGAVILLGVVLLVSGCLCCGGTDFGGLTSNGSQTCEAPYIQVGDSCCLDNDGNGICDDEETTDTTLSADDTLVTETTETTETTLPDEVDTDTTESPTTTVQSTSYASTYECVRAAGYDPNKVIFGYSQRCGSNFVSTASTVSGRGNVDILPVNIGGMLEDKKVKMLECFYGKNSAEMGACPRLLCPKSGRYQTLTGTAASSVSSQMSGFAKACK